MENPTLSPEAQIYKDSYDKCFADLCPEDQQKVKEAVGKEGEPDKIVVRFIKRVIAKAEAPPPEPTKTEQKSKGDNACDTGQPVLA